MTARYFMGVDVGTGSARAGIFDAEGALLAQASRPIRMWREQPHHVEQSSDDIWRAVCDSSREAVAQAGIDPAAVAGIGFDATCSLVVLDDAGQPVAVNAQGDDCRNVIVWMDHRATEQAARINAMGDAVLDYVGGRISPEMETPKLLWLKENLPQAFDRAAHFFDLTDYLTFRATGSLWRSTCTVTCKWTYLAHEDRWSPDYFRKIGLGDLADEGFARIGTTIRPPAAAIPEGLSAQAAQDLGLSQGIAVAMGLIDAHAGAIGTIGAQGIEAPLSQRLAYVFGTSACTLNVTQEPSFVDGVWGPYFSALVPGMWLSEGGQSAAGAAIDHLVKLHPFAAQASALAQADGQSLTFWLEAKAVEALQHNSLADIIGGLHVVPEFLGNRAPFADPDARAMIAGLGMEDDEASLVALYLAGLCAIGYGLRQILAALAAKGADLSTVIISGGAGRSPLVRQCLADAAGVTIATCTTAEPVLLGAAMTAAVAAGDMSDLSHAMQTMSHLGAQNRPDLLGAWHDKRFAAFEAMQALGRELRR